MERHTCKIRSMKKAVRAYLGSIAAVGAAIAATFFVQAWIGTSMSILFFPAVVVPAIYGGFGPALLATVLSTFSLAFLFVPPLYSLNVGAADAVRLLVFAVISYATAWVSSARRHAEEAQRESLRSLQAALDIMRKVSAWPLVIDADTSKSSCRTNSCCNPCRTMGWSSTRIMRILIAACGLHPKM